MAEKDKLQKIEKNVDEININDKEYIRNKFRISAKRMMKKNAEALKELADK